MIWTAKPFSLTLILVLFPAGLVFLMWVDKSQILIESLESKTIAGRAVYNKIQFQRNLDSDIWLMEQSHSGPNSPHSEWDKIAIVVNRDGKVRRSDFYQLAPGPEPISMKLKPIGLKASCFFCHSNGPRAIRPNLDSSEAKISYWDQARLQLWNLRIKTYGPIESQSPTISKKKFRYEHPAANRELNVKSCTKCHNSDLFVGRGVLTKQNFMTIKFLVENRFMPPPGFKITDEDRLEINEFINL